MARAPAQIPAQARARTPPLARAPARTFAFATMTSSLLPKTEPPAGARAQDLAQAGRQSPPLRRPLPALVRNLLAQARKRCRPAPPRPRVQAECIEAWAANRPAPALRTRTAPRGRRPRDLRPSARRWPARAPWSDRRVTEEVPLLSPAPASAPAPASRRMAQAPARRLQQPPPRSSEWPP